MTAAPTTHVVPTGPGATLDHPSPPRRQLPVPTAAQLRQVRTLVREGRRLAHDQHASEAAQKFRAAIAITPRDPQLHCELGYVLREQDPDEAVVQLRHGMALFGSRASPSTTQPIASCWFNLGLALEIDDSAEAIRAYRHSLALRENATVRRHLLALQMDEFHEPDSEALAASSLEQLVHVLDARSKSRCEDESDCESAEVTLLARQAATGQRPETGWIQETKSDHLTDRTDYSVVVREPGGYRLAAMHSTLDDTVDHGHSADSTLTPGEVSMASPGWLRIDYQTVHVEGWEGLVSPADEVGAEACDCYEASSETCTSDWVALCRLADWQCLTLVSAVTEETEGSVTRGHGDNRPAPAWAQALAEHSVTHTSYRLEFGEAGVRRHLSEGEQTGRGPPLDEWIPWDRALELFRPGF